MILRSRKTSFARRGFSLIEVIVAMFIFLMALVGVGKLVEIGSDLAIEADLQSEGASRCQSKMAEVVFGAVALQAQSDAPLDEDPNWTWSMSADQDSSVNGLWKVSITFTRKRSDGDPISCTIEEFVVDPSIRGSTMDAPATTNSTSTTGGN